MFLWAEEREAGEAGRWGVGWGGRKALASNWQRAIKGCCETADKGSPLTAGLFSGVLMPLLRVGKTRTLGKQKVAAGVWRTDGIAEPWNDNSVFC